MKHNSDKLNNESIAKPPKKRIWELDFLRGICILLMVMDHSFFDLWYIFYDAYVGAGGYPAQLANFAKWYWSSDIRGFVWQLVVWTFFMLCGISSSFSRNNLRRTIELWLVAGVLTLGTFILTKGIKIDALGIDFQLSGVLITYGVIHMLASCMLVWFIVSLISKDKYKIATICFGLSLFIIILNKYIPLWTGEMTGPKYLGFIHPSLKYIDFSEGDYFPLIPNLAVFLLGAVIGPTIYGKRKTILPCLDKRRWYRPVNFFGRHTLAIVLLHQPLIAILLALISYFFMTPGNFVIF